MKALEVQHLTKVFKTGIRRQTLTALSDVTFDLERGSVLGVLGPNGSGKSTLFKCILGFIKPTGGSLKILGDAFQGRALTERIGYLHEKVNFYPELTPREHLDFFGRLYRMPPSLLKARIPELLDLVDLSRFADVRVHTFSKGMLQRVGIAVSLVQDAEFLIFDEPTSGLDLFGIESIKNIMKKLVERGKTLLVSSHALADIQEICNEVIILYQGRLLQRGPVASLLNNLEAFQITVHSDGSRDDEAVALLQRAGFQIEATGHPVMELSDYFTGIIGREQ